MARLAERLGYTTMALYRHVRSKDELVALMVEEATTLPTTGESAAADWRAALNRCSWNYSLSYDGIHGYSTSRSRD